MRVMVLRIRGPTTAIEWAILALMIVASAAVLFTVVLLTRGHLVTVKTDNNPTALAAVTNINQESLAHEVIMTPNARSGPIMANEGIVATTTTRRWEARHSNRALWRPALGVDWGAFAVAAVVLTTTILDRSMVHQT